MQEKRLKGCRLPDYVFYHCDCRALWYNPGAMLHWLVVVVLLIWFSPADAAPRADVIRHAKTATVLIAAINDANQSVSMGSGFFVADNGLLVTNAHVIEGHTRLLVYIHDEIIVSPEILAVDADADLAALRVSLADLPTLPLAADYPEEGTEVMAIGYPRITDVLQMGFALHAAAAPGTVSGMAPGRSRTKGRHAAFVETMGILNFGNSGGPLIDRETGQVIGMVVTTVPYLERAKDRNGTAIGSVSLKAGIGYSIPSPVIRQWLRKHQLATGGEVLRRAKGFRRHGPDAEPGRSFATGHLLHTVALVLHQDSDLLRLAIQHYETAAALKPKALWIARNLGLAYADDGQWPSALQAYLKGLESAPNDVFLLNEAGLAWEKTGHPSEAAECYRSAVHLNPGFGRAHNNLGHLLWEAGQHEEAIAEFRAALDADPTLALASYNLGLALEANGLHAEAVRTWEAFLEQGSPMTDDEWTAKIHEGLTRVRSSTDSRSTSLTTATEP